MPGATPGTAALRRHERAGPAPASGFAWVAMKANPSRFLLVTLLAAGLSACSSTGLRGDDELRELASRMTGDFSSAAQAAADPDYYEITLRMARIWPERADGYWLYVEQAVAKAQEKPYRQRVYLVRRVEEDLFESRVFTLPEPERFVGAWKETGKFAALRPEDLAAREGCEILLRRQGDSFAGSTLGALCQSSLRGASYATSEVSIGETSLVSWDRGFDGKGEQVWGAVKGGYVFEKLADFRLE